MISFGRIETLAILTGCLAMGLLGCSCSTMKPLNYTVAVMNEGRESIRLMPFQLTSDPDTTVAFGEVFPAGRKSMSPYYCRPTPTLDFTWRLLRTGEERRAQAVTELPKEFTKDRGSAVVFHIKPEEGAVAVTYEIRDPKTGQMSVIRQGERSAP